MAKLLSTEMSRARRTQCLQATVAPKTPRAFEAQPGGGWGWEYGLVEISISTQNPLESSPFFLASTMLVTMVR